MTQAIEGREPDAAAFRELCPWVIIPDDQTSYWNLPEGYEEVRIDEGVSIWKG